jgi:hypothetical protein
MQSNQETDKIARLQSEGHMFNGGCSRRWFCGLSRAALLAIVFSGTVAFTTGCSSTGGGANASFIAPSAQPGVTENEAGYQPPRSPNFSELTGG